MKKTKIQLNKEMVEVAVSSFVHAFMQERNLDITTSDAFQVFVGTFMPDEDEISTLLNHRESCGEKISRQETVWSRSEEALNMILADESFKLALRSSLENMIDSFVDVMIDEQCSQPLVQAKVVQ